MEEEDDDVEFVTDIHLKPVVDTIVLLSDDDDEDEGGFSAANCVGDADECGIEEQVVRQRARTASTLDRLAQQVALSSQERADKCRDFKKRMILQKAHGLHGVSRSQDSEEARRCVDLWLKMPALPSLCPRRPSTSARLPLSPQTCPVINCNRVYDNLPLLEGHLKRYDHSPCDPTITLKGSSSSIVACVACGKHFSSRDSWRQHVESELSSHGHSSSSCSQLIVCFACPACFLLFNIRDECLQHMSAKNHFTHTITLSVLETPVVPIPVPRFAKNRLIALCKETRFSVTCSLCAKVLTSHMEARAHFNVHCRQGCAVATSEQSLADIIRKMTVVGQCSSCPKPFLNLKQITEHRTQTGHDVMEVGSMDRALLYYSHYYEAQNTPQRTAVEPSFSGQPLAKRQKLGASGSQSEVDCPPRLAWFCECGLRFAEEEQARKHLLAANQVFHKCAVCGKLMGESSIARLHMSRFHGGAHLSNFLFHCRQCKVDLPRMEDITSHIGVRHRGHTFYQEREDRQQTSVTRPSTSAGEHLKIGFPVHHVQSPESWLCRMCEDLFESEEAVQKHCGDLSAHSFQRFACGHCPQRFFKDSTLRRHCGNEHNGDIVRRYFCGLCDSMLYDTEEEFWTHYSSLHGRDYYRLEKSHSQEPVENQTPVSGPQLCVCMGRDQSKEERKVAFTKCMKLLATEKNCLYVCLRCERKIPSYAEMKTHVVLQHKETLSNNQFEVFCTLCSETLHDVPGFHSHYHERHCCLEPCVSARVRCESQPSDVDVKPEAAAEETQPESSGTDAEKFHDAKKVLKSEEDDDRAFDEDMKLALALSAEEAEESAQLDIEMRQALEKSLLDF